MVDQLLNAGADLVGKTLTDGNSSTHLRKLESSQYVAIDKRFEGRKPVTEVSLTEQGRAAFCLAKKVAQGLGPG